MAISHNKFQDEFFKGPYLPMDFFYHCATKLNDSFVLLTGGVYNNGKTLLVDTLSIGLFTLPKCVRFSNFELFWVAEIILNQSYFNHFFLNDCLEVANLI